MADLDDEIFELCAPAWAAELPPSEGTLNDHLLSGKLMRLMLHRQLFTFVTAAVVKTPRGEMTPVGCTNNERGYDIYRSQRTGITRRAN